METCYVTFKKKPVNKKSSLRRTKQNRFSNCDVFWQKESRFFKKQEATGLLSSLVITTPLSSIPLTRDTLS